MDGPKVEEFLALVKPNYMLETPQKFSSTRIKGCLVLVKIWETRGQSAGKIASRRCKIPRDYTFGGN